MAGEQNEREGIADFMDVIQDYPSIYNRSSKDFKDKFKKDNFWKAVAERARKQKALVRNGIERLFLELEVGSRGFAPSPHQSFFQSSCHVSSVLE